MSEETVHVPLESELDSFFGQYTAANESRGLVYGLTDAEGLIHSSGFGAVNDEGLVPDADTVFPIASMSKSFVACAALSARDQGLLSLGDPITRYVPEFVVIGDACRIDGMPTVEMLLSMCGGLTEDNSWVDPFLDLSIDDFLTRVNRGVRLSHYPGTQFETSNLGFALAGLAVSRAVGAPLKDYVKGTLFTPLGLTSTYFDSTVPNLPKRAIGYSLGDDGSWMALPPQKSEAFAAAGGIVSTVTDLSKWITWLGAAFRPPSEEDVDVVSRTSRRELQRMRVPVPPALTVGSDGSIHATMSGYALGLRVAMDFHRGAIVSHAGGLHGFKLFMTWHPPSGIGVIVLTNSHRGDPFSLCSDALGRALARHHAPASEVRMWPETTALRALAEGLIRDWDEDVALQVFADNVAIDRPFAVRRCEIDRMVSEIGPLLEPATHSDVVSVVTSADVTWSIPGRSGELLCMIHVTPAEPAQIQEFVVKAFPASRPRAVRPVDISPRRSYLGEAHITPITNVRIATSVSPE